MAIEVPAIVINGELFTLQDGTSIKLAEERLLTQMDKLPISKATKVAKLIVKLSADKPDFIPSDRIIKFARCQYGNHVDEYIKKRQMLCKEAEHKQIYQEILEKKNFVTPETFVYLVQEMDKTASINPATYSYLAYERFITIDPVESLLDSLND